MYGFVEKHLADLVEGLDCEPFILNDGGEAVMLGRDDFERVYSALLRVWRFTRDSEINRPKVFESDIVGMRIIIHRYWFNENILHCLTSAQTKTHEKYLSFLDMPTPRFDVHTFTEKFREFFNGSHLDAEGSGVSYPERESDPVEEEGEVEEEAVAEEEVVEKKPVDEEKAPVADKCDKDEKKFYEYIKNDFFNRVSHDTVRNKKGYKRVFYLGSHFRSDDLDSMLVKLSDDTGKNILFSQTSNSTTFYSMMRKKFSISEISKHTIILFANPAHFGSKFQSPGVSERNSSICFGESIRGLYFTKGGIERQKEIIKNDDSLTKEEVAEKLEALKRRPEMSAYARYDQIFKDSKTNVVWALRDRCAIYMMFAIDERSVAAYKVCLKELGRRFHGDMSHEEIRKIDEEYHNLVASRNQSDYIDFSIKSCKRIIDDLKGMRADAETKYKDHLNKTMEFGKLVTKYVDQINSFDEDGLTKKEREKALHNYEETIKIPEVLSINVEEEMIHVYTKNIYAQDERSKKWHDIGTFHIMLGLIGNSYDTDSTVKIMNTKHQVSGLNSAMQAPHVFPDGNICHGSLAKGMIEAYKRRNLFELIYQLVIFLENANTNDEAGKYIDRWPEVSAEIAIGAFDSYEEKEPSKEEKEFDGVLADALPVKI